MPNCYKSSSNCSSSLFLLTSLRTSKRVSRPASVYTPFLKWDYSLRQSTVSFQWKPRLGPLFCLNFSLYTPPENNPISIRLSTGPRTRYGPSHDYVHMHTTQNYFSHFAKAVISHKLLICLFAKLSSSTISFQGFPDFLIQRCVLFLSSLIALIFLIYFDYTAYLCGFYLHVCSFVFLLSKDYFCSIACDPVSQYPKSITAQLKMFSNYIFRSKCK